MKSKKVLAVLLTLLLTTTSVLVGCGKEKAPAESTPASTAAEAYNGPKVLDYYVGEEPETLNAQLMTGQPDMFVANMFIEGLVRFGKEEGKYVPGVAKSWKYDTATSTYSFELRKDAKWTDGTPVTAADFFFGWRLGLDEVSQYSNMITDYVKGAKEYADLTKEGFYASKDAALKDLIAKRDAEKDAAKNKELASQVSAVIEKLPDSVKAEYKTAKDNLWSKVGVKDNNGTIEIQLVGPCTYYVGLTAMPVYYPVNEKFYNAHKSDYTLEASGLNCNGPWVMKEWKHKDSFTLEKNPNYWNKDAIKIDKLNIKIVNDVATRTNLLKTGQLDGSAIQSDDLKVFQDKAVRDQYNLQDLIDMPDYTVFYFEFNHINNKITQNVNIRKAFAYAQDRKGLVEKVSQGDMPGLALIPDYFAGLEKTFREENGKTLFEDNNKEKAKQFLAQGLKELNMDKLPPLDCLVGNSDVAKKQAEKLQSDLKEVGIEITIVPIPWGERLKRTKNGDFAVNSAGWGPDYMDPMTYLAIFVSGDGNNHGKYSNPKYDELINKALKETDAKKRMQYMYGAEKLLIQEDMAVAPQYDRVAHWTFKNYLTGVINRGIGPTTDFYYADIDMKAKEADKKK